MNYLAAGLAIIILILVYYMYYYFTNTSLTAGLQDLHAPVTVPYQKLTNPGALTYSYQCWLFLSAPTAGPQPIIYRGAGTAGSYNEFEVDLSGQQLTLMAGPGGSTAPSLVMTITPNFPIQKWTYLVINVTNLKTYEAYLNGKLVKTVNVTKNLKPSSNMSTLFIGNAAITGYATMVTRTTTVLDAKTVWNNYLSGNGLNNFFSNLIPYGLTMSIANGEDVQRVFKLF